METALTAELKTLNETMKKVADALVKLADDLEVLKDQEDQYLETTQCHPTE